MIQQFEFIAEDEKGLAVNQSYAYRIYSALMEKIPFELAEYSHLQGYSPFSQFLMYDNEIKKSRWIISLMNDKAIDSLGKVLHGLDCIELHGERINLSCAAEGNVLDFQDIIHESELISDSSKKSMSFLSVTSFKSQHQYLIFPDEAHIIQSLIRKWNVAFPDAVVEDEDAVQMLLNCISIADYKLKSSRYRMKNTSVPGFIGTISFNERLALPMMELWKMLFVFAQYSGVGIKSALGMGGVKCDSK